MILLFFPIVSSLSLLCPCSYTPWYVQLAGWKEVDFPIDLAWNGHFDATARQATVLSSALQLWAIAVPCALFHIIPHQFKLNTLEHGNIGQFTSFAHAMSLVKCPLVKYWQIQVGWFALFVLQSLTTTVQNQSQAAPNKQWLAPSLFCCLGNIEC